MTTKTPKKHKPRASSEATARKKAGHIIHQAIVKAGFTIRSFAKSISVAASTVSRWCAGKRFPGNRKTLQLLRDRLGINPADLV